MAKTKDKRILTTILKAIVYVAISFVCLLTIFLLYYVVSSQMHADDESYRPKVSIYTIVSPSMTPVINVYDVVVNVAVDDPKAIEIGDIITYKSQSSNSEGMTITHRVIAIDQLPDGTYEYLTQGDNNSEPDSSYVTFDNVIGREIVIIPYLGRLQFLIANHKWWLILLIIPIGIYLVREIVKLIDLLNLRNKVDLVTGEKEDSVIVKKKIENQEKKEKIKQELELKEIERESLVRSPFEPAGFLEKYTETMVDIPINKYDKKNKNKVDKITSVEETPEVKEEKVDDTITIKPTNLAIEEDKKEELVTEAKEETSSKEALKESEPTIDIKKEVEEKNANGQYEILDTDELSSKIKEYDSKISQLDKMIKDMESISATSEKEEPTKDEDREVENFLQGGRLKVTKVELTENNEESKEKRKKEKIAKEQEKLEQEASHQEKPEQLIIEEKTNENPLEEQIALSTSGSTSLINPNRKIARPQGEDIATLRGGINNTNSNIKPVELPPKKEKAQSSRRERLNLNPRNVKKVNRPGNSRSRKNLNLNPNNVKKVRRPRQMQEQAAKMASTSKKTQIPTTSQKKTQTAKIQRKNSKLISLEKIK